MGLSSEELQLIIRARNLSGPALAELQSQIGAAGTAVSAANSKMATTAAAAGKVGSAMTRYITVPVMAAAAASVYLAIKFDESMQKIADYTGSSAAQMKEYRNAILSLAPAVGQGPDKLSDALYYVISRGYKGAAALNILKVSAQAASAGMGDTTTVAQAATTAMYDYSASHLTAAQAIDTMVTAVRLGAMAPADFAAALGRILPISAALHVSFPQISADLASLTRAGMTSSAATMGLRMVLLGLEAPTSAGVKTLKSLGLSAKGVKDDIAKNGLLDTLVMLRDRLGDNVAGMKSLTGGSRGLGTFLALTANDGKKAQTAIDAMAHSTGAAAAAFKTWEDSPTGKMHLALATLEGDGTKLGAVLLPVFTALVGDVTKVVDVFANLPKGVQESALGLVFLAAAAGPVLKTFSLMYSTVVALRGAYLALAAAETLSGGAGGAGGAAPSVYAGLSANGAKGAQLITRSAMGGGESAAVAGASMAGPIALAVGVAVAAIVGGVIAAHYSGKEGTAESQAAMGVAIRTGQVGRGANGGNGPLTATAAGAGAGGQSVLNLIAKLNVQGSTASMGQLKSILAEVKALQAISHNPILLGKINGKATQDSARDLRDKLMTQFKLTRSQANAIVSQLLHVKVTDYVTPQMTAAQKKIAARLAAIRANTLKPFQLGGLTGTESILNELGRISSSLGFATNAASSLASALARVNLPGGGGGHVSVHGTGGIFNSPQMGIIGDTREVLLPLDDKRRTAQLMQQAGLLSAGYWGGAGGGASVGAGSAGGGIRGGDVIVKGNVYGVDDLYGLMQDAAASVMPDPGSAGRIKRRSYG